jgi:hypothetical protein
LLVQESRSVKGHPETSQLPIRFRPHCNIMRWKIRKLGRATSDTENRRLEIFLFQEKKYETEIKMCCVETFCLKLRAE